MSDGLGLGDLGFMEEDIIYPCYSIKVLPRINGVEVHRNRKMIKRFKLSSFPPHIDFNNLDDIGKIISIVKEEGCVGLMNKFQLE
jgi:hypothetical protein